MAATLLQFQLPIATDQSALFITLYIAYLGASLIILFIAHQNSTRLNVSLALQTLLDTAFAAALVIIAGAYPLILSALQLGSLFIASFVLSIPASLTLAIIAGAAILLISIDDLPQSSAFVLALLSLPLLGKLIVANQKPGSAETEPRMRGLIEQLPLGLVITDKLDQVLTINSAAKQMFTSNNLQEEVRALLSQWRQSSSRERKNSFHTSQSQVIPFIEETHEYNILLLVDINLLQEQAQDIKISALSRLTASIAHEIRNPLGAISHAGQLLHESVELNPSDRRLTEIIYQQTQRMNAIVEDVMQLGRGDHAEPQLFQLHRWLDEFVEAFCQTQGIIHSQIKINLADNDLQATVDPNHLHQILSNLCINAIKHGQPLNDRHLLAINASNDETSHKIFIDVIDGGDAIDETTVKQLFEPFFTTKSNGSGLGLYIAKELCDANNARISYLGKQSGENRFRLTLLNQQKITVR